MSIRDRIKVYATHGGAREYLKGKLIKGVSANISLVNLLSIFA